LNYFYIPLNGEFYNKKTGSSKKIRTINTDKYLIGYLDKKGIKYKVATYVVQTDTNKFDYTVNANSKKIKSVQFINHTVKYSKFSGTLVLLDLYSNNTNTYKYNNGMYQPKNPKISANSQSQSSNSSQIKTNAQICTYTLTCTYFNNFQDACGDGTDYEENSTPINDPNIGEQNCTPPPSAARDNYGNLCYIYWEFGGYDVQLDFCYTIPDPPPPPPQDPGDGTANDSIITNNTNNPCLHNMVNSAIKRNIQYDLKNSMNSIFGGKQTNFNLNFSDAILDSTTSGITDVVSASGNYNEAERRYTELYSMNVNITLNNTVLPGGSEEFTTATILHEVLHAYFRVTNTSFDHEVMVSHYIPWFTSTLKSIYPTMSDYDATSLAYGGLTQTAGFGLGLEAPMLNFYLLNNDSYKTAKSGTPCK